MHPRPNLKSALTKYPIRFEISGSRVQRPAQATRRVTVSGENWSLEGGAPLNTHVVCLRPNVLGNSKDTPRGLSRLGVHLRKHAGALPTKAAQSLVQGTMRTLSLHTLVVALGPHAGGRALRTQSRTRRTGFSHTHTPCTARTEDKRRVERGDEIADAQNFRSKMYRKLAARVS